MKLQDISTAPKNGTHIIAYGRHENDCDEREEGFCEIYWLDDLKGWYNITHYPSYPVAWFPVPDIKGFKLAEGELE